MEYLLSERAYERYKDDLGPIEWLGFDHHETRCYDLAPLDRYPLQRGWTTKEINQTLSGRIVDRRGAAML